MSPMLSLSSSGRLGTTPSASSFTPSDAESSTAVPKTWYDQACLPYARGVTSLMASWQIKGPEYLLLEVGLFRLARVTNGIDVFCTGCSEDDQDALRWPGHR